MSLILFLGILGPLFLGRDFDVWEMRLRGDHFAEDARFWCKASKDILREERQYSGQRSSQSKLFHMIFIPKYTKFTCFLHGVLRCWLSCLPPINFALGKFDSVLFEE